MKNAKDASIAYIAIGQAKAKKGTLELFILGILAGAYIAIAGSVANLAVHTVGNFGLAKTLAAVLFPTGLCMVILSGAELFTGNSLMGIALMSKKITLPDMLRNWCLVYLGNFVGSVLVALFVVLAKQLGNNNMELAAYTIKVATAKASLSFGPAIVSGFMCNFLVCTAVFMASQSDTLPGKVIGAYLPVFFFVIASFEHVIANMFYLSVGLFAKMVPDYAAAAASAGVDAAKLTWGNAIINNYIPVTIGNVIGGVTLALLLWHINVRPGMKVSKDSGVTLN